MRLRTLAAVFTALLLLASAGCKSSDLPPSPSSLINGTRDRLNPFRMTLTTDPAYPHPGPVGIKVHVIDAANQPADGVTLKADISMAGMDHGAQHLTLDGRGNGDYDGQVTLEMAGSWDVDLTASKDDKSKQLRLMIDVGN
jgi:hypothetical protein